MFSTLLTINLQKKDDVINLEPLGDLHVGHVGFNQAKYVERLKAIIKDDLRYTLFMGDQLDAISPQDKRWQQDSVRILDIDDQRNEWQKISQPLIDVHHEYLNDYGTPKIVGLEAGNHEYKAATQSYIRNQFCEPNLIKYLGSKCFIGLDIRYKGETLRRWKIFATHGTGGGSNPLTALENIMVQCWSDVYMMGHLHDKAIQSRQVVDFKFGDNVNGKEINHWVSRDIVLANTGTFCDTYTDGVDGYMDRKNKVRPSKLGTITISFDALNGKIHAHE